MIRWARQVMIDHSPIAILAFSITHFIYFSDARTFNIKLYASQPFGACMAILYIIHISIPIPRLYYQAVVSVSHVSWLAGPFCFCGGGRRRRAACVWSFGIPPVLSLLLSCLSHAVTALVACAFCSHACQHGGVRRRSLHCVQFFSAQWLVLAPASSFSALLCYGGEWSNLSLFAAVVWLIRRCCVMPFFYFPALQITPSHFCACICSWPSLMFSLTMASVNCSFPGSILCTHLVSRLCWLFLHAWRGLWLAHVSIPVKTRTGSGRP